jgi:Tol biopolymer transport system component
MVIALSSLSGCAHSEDTGGGKQQEADDSSGQRQQVDREQSIVEAQSGKPTRSVELGERWGSTLVFQSAAGEMWAMGARGSEPLRLTEKGESYPTPSLSPDGKKIAFASSRTEGGCGGGSSCASANPEVSYAQIYVMNADGSDQELLLEEEGGSSPPTWSPDGKEIAFALADDAGCTIYAMKPDGSEDPTSLATVERCSLDSLSWSPDGEKMAFEGSVAYNRFDIWVVDVSGEGKSTPRQLTHTPDLWWNVDPTWSPDSTEIAFTHMQTEGYRQNIHKIDADGSGEVVLTRGPAFHANPTSMPLDTSYSPINSPVFSPDGTKIALVRGYRPLADPDPSSPAPLESSEVYVMDSDGSDPTVVKNFPSEQLANLQWLPGDVDLPLIVPDKKAVSEGPDRPADGCKPVENPVGEIAYEAGGDIWTTNEDGSNPTRLTSDRSQEGAPAFSPDGGKIAFAKEVEVETKGGSLSGPTKQLVGKIAIMDTDGCDQTVLPVPAGKGAYEPSWAPGGLRVAFWFTGDCGIFITKADGSGTPRTVPTPGVPGCAARPEWSPDGTRIAFEGYGQDGWADIYLMDVLPDGTTDRPRQLPHEGLEQATEPTWSPDGTEIAFSGSHSGYHATGKGHQAIFKIDVNSLELTRLTKGSDTEHSPSWSPDGGQIAYVRDAGAGSSIYVVDSDGSDPTLVRDLPADAGRPDWRP